MKLGKAGIEKCRFAAALVALQTYIISRGYQYYLGDGTCRDGHRENSYHYRGLAQDIHLFSPDGEYLTKTEDHADIGAYWESLDKMCTWGGRWNDGNHYSWGEVLR